MLRSLQARSHNRRRASLPDAVLIAKVLALFAEGGGYTPLFKTIRDHFMDRSRQILEMLVKKGFVILRTRRARSAQSVSQSGLQLQTVWAMDLAEGVTAGEVQDELAKIGKRLLTPTMTKAGMGLDQGDVGHVSVESSASGSGLEVTFGMYLLHPDSAVYEAAKKRAQGEWVGQNQLVAQQIMRQLDPQSVTSMMPASLRGSFRMEDGLPEVKSDARRGVITVEWTAKAVPISEGAQGVNFAKTFEISAADLSAGTYLVSSPSAKGSFKPEEVAGLSAAADAICGDLFRSLSAWFKGVEYQNPVQPQAEEWRSHVSKLVGILRGMKFRLPGRGEFKFMRVTEHPPKQNLLATVVLPPVLSRPMVTDANLRRDVMVGVQQAMDKAAGRGILEITEWVPAKGVFLIGHAGG
jgi:hypothetical protein